jgi:voltage-gated potassium channel
MKRHYQVIFESLLTVLIIIDLLLMGLMIAGLTVGIKAGTVYNIGNYDLIITLLILIDFIVFRIKTNKLNGNNKQFIKNNWAYIVSIIPLIFICFNIFHLFNFIDIIGLIIILRFYALYKVLKITGKEIRKYPSKTKLDYATVILLLVLVIGSFLFFLVEHGVNPEVPTYDSAMWYSIVSMTTVGYGDIVPITAIGRVIGIIIILTGMGYVSLVTATLAYSFVDFFRTESRKAADRVEKKVIGYEEKIDELINTVNKLEEKIDETKTKKD